MFWVDYLNGPLLASLLPADGSVMKYVPAIELYNYSVSNKWLTQLFSCSICGERSLKRPWNLLATLNHVCHRDRKRNDGTWCSQKLVHMWCNTKVNDTKSDASCNMPRCYWDTNTEHNSFVWCIINGQQTGCQKTESDTSGRSACTRLCTKVPRCNSWSIADLQKTILNAL